MTPAQEKAQECNGESWKHLEPQTEVHKSSRTRRRLGATPPKGDSILRVGVPQQGHHMRLNGNRIRDSHKSDLHRQVVKALIVSQMVSRRDKKRELDLYKVRVEKADKVSTMSPGAFRWW